MQKKYNVKSLIFLIIIFIVISVPELNKQMDGWTDIYLRKFFDELR